MGIFLWGKYDFGQDFFACIFGIQTWFTTFLYIRHPEWNEGSRVPGTWILTHKGCTCYHSSSEWRTKGTIQIKIL